jgi:pimeloyl-ACP methyl ester carboxylesterase
VSIFILVHGAWHGGWSFDTIRPLLEEAGHKVVTPDLPGMGGSDEELAAVTLGSWADYVADLCRAQGEPVILAGHSRGGIVISEVAERAPDSVKALAYICAALIPDGYSRARWREGSGPNPAFAAIQRQHPSGHATTLNPEMAPAVLAQLSPPDLVADAMARLTAEPNAPRGDVLHLSEARYGSVPRHYIECTADLAIPIDEQRRMIAAQPCASVTTIDTDHSPFLSAPDALASALILIAEDVISGSTSGRDPVRPFG